jgi:hypothetical protein
MADKRWEFELDGARHVVELEHSTFSGKQYVRVDGRLLAQQEGAQGRFRIENHACEVRVVRQGRTYLYDLLIDGVSNTQEQYAKEWDEAQSSETMKSWRRAAIIMFISLGVLGNWFNWYWATTRGRYFEELALLMPAIMFIGLYWIVFPKDFVAQYSGISVRMWIAIALAFLLGFVNTYALSHGWY